MQNSIHPVLYFFSLFYFVYVLIGDFGAIVKSPLLSLLAVFGVIGFIYGFKYLRKN